MNHQRREGDIFPGFDLALGKAVGYNRGEWQKLLESTTVHRRNGYLIAVDADGLPLFEVFDDRNQIRPVGQ